ncbi:endo-1,4-beta-xylanase [Bacillus sp. FJAT-28004]|uniref:endo-1,4-beta-xylanase n=1 Tax=Bacillus sp. FJAT-28004 TaxID=1679165 RepID=UPI0006B4FCE9|nr:endo-1,4-beta-xylanase [Bacillus sp. FJAT-28004]
MRSKLSLLLAFILLFGLLMPIGRFGSTAQAAASTVLQNGFEDGSIGSWKPFNCSGGTAQTVVSTEQAAAGSNALKLSGRGSVSCSPSIELNAVLQEGHIYDISFKAKLGSGSDQAHVTMRMTNQTNNFDWIIGNQNIDDQSWTTFSKKSYTRPSGTTSMTMYLETASSAADVFIDDVLIVDNTPQGSSGGSGTSPIGPLEFGYNFDGGTAEGWGPRGDGVAVALSQEQQKSGQYSLKTTGRSKDWHGPTVSVFDKMTKDAKYEVTASIKMTETPSASRTIKLSAEQDASGSKSWVSIASAAVATSDWVQLKGTFSYHSNLTDISFYIESSDVNDSFYIDDINILMTEPPKTSPPVQTDLAKLKDVYKDYFKMGAALEPNQLEGKSRELLDMHFSSVVAENAMKPGSINSTKGTYNFESADRLAKFARDNKVNMRFHTLVWHQQTADWMFNDDNGTILSPTPENKVLVLNRLKDYLSVVVPRYADVATDWDVVNEVIDEGRPNGMRNSLWYQLTGEDFIKVAFTETRRLLDEMYAQDPVKYAIAKSSKLVINDYGTNNPQKANFLLSLLTRLKAEGVPIDAVGHQTHINISGPSIQQISNSIKMFGEAGFDNQLTEFDVSVYTNNTDAYQVVPQDLIVKQGYRFKELFDELKKLDNMGRTVANPEGWISNVTFWGIADDHTWLHNRPVTRQDAPFAFDKNFQAKPAFWGMVDPSKLTAVKKAANAANGSPNQGNINDLIWNTVPAIPLEKSGVLEAAMKILWDENNLYVKAMVTDPSKLAGDKVELFVKSGTQMNKVQVERGTADAVETNKGYSITAVIPLSGSTMGSNVPFDIRVTDSGADDGTEHGKNGSIISWSDLGNNQDENSSGFGDLTLIAATKISTANYGTPILDGEMDEKWASASKLTTAVKVEGGEGSKAEFYSMWDDEHLYVYAVVTDKKLSDASVNPWEHDSIEIFVDQNNGKTSSYEGDDGQYRINYKNVHTVGGHASHDNYTSVTKTVYGTGDLATGYIVEAAINLDKITPSNGTTIGFDLQVNNDDNGTGKRDSVWMWNDPTGKSYENTSRFGVIALNGKPESGGDTGTGGSGNTGNIPATKPSEINATVDTNGNAKASISASDLKNAIAEAKAGLLKFQVKGVDMAKQVAITIPAQQVQAAKEAGIKTIEFNAGLAAIQLPISLFEAADPTVNIEFIVSKIAAETLSNGVREQIGSNAVYDFSLSIGGKIMSQFGNGQSVDVSVPYALKSGENINQIVIFYIHENGKLEVIKSSKYDAVTGMAQFNTTHFSKYAAVSVDVSFKDIASITWAKDSIVGLAARGIVSGVTAQAFEPNRSVTRAEFIHMLIQTLNLEQAGASSSFRDVKKGTWYYNSVASAQQLGIVTGLTDGTFSINDKISRQDMAAMAYRALQKTDITLEQVNDKVDFNDAAAIAAYAKEAVAMLQTAGTINGMGNGSFLPLDTASRAQAAVILYELLQKSMN